VRRELPSGTVTFLFTDIEGSTKLLHQLGPTAYADALAEHRRILRDACARHGGVEVDNQGDALFIAFPTAEGAIDAAREGQQALAAGPIRVRMGIHTGTPYLTAEGYVGGDVHRAARIAAAGHGGQVLVSASTAALAASDGLRDLGQHRLKDLTGPERIFQIGADEHPPLQSLSNTNLPVPTTSFLGRERELADVSGLLARPDVRLVTLSGPGGTGKTRLSLQAAGTAAAAFPAGVWWVPLAAIREPGLVLTEAARALGAQGDLAEHVGDKRILLLFDNFEQVMGAAPGVGSLLERCPNLTVLVTSREALRVRGEWEYAVEPLREPDAVALFATRAVAARHDFAANGEIHEICRRLDHLPLAIELAAARVRVMSPRAILERLEQRLPLLASGPRDAPDRQRTLRAAIAWSYDLLSQEEQRLFARLAVFRGGWTLGAAEQVADADLDTLASLVEKSLVRQRDDRFWILETIHEFATERLDGSGESDDVRNRHADHFLAVAEEAEPHVMRDDLCWLDRLQGDHDNLRAALDRLATVDPVAHARGAGALWRFWYSKSHFAEGLRRLDAALAGVREASPIRAKCLQGASVQALNLGDTDASLHYAREALELERQLGNGWGVAYASMMVGNALAEAHGELRDLPAARARLEESARLFDEVGDRHYALIARHNRAWIVGELGDPASEERLHREALDIAREIGNEGIEADSLAQLAMAARDAGRFDEAVALLRDSIRIDHRRGMTSAVATQLGRLSSVHVRAGRPDLAAQLVAASGGLTEALGADMPWWSQRRSAETLELLRGAGLAPSELDELLARGRALSVDAAVELALEG